MTRSVNVYKYVGLIILGVLIRTKFSIEFSFLEWLSLVISFGLISLEKVNK